MFLEFRFDTIMLTGICGRSKTRKEFMLPVTVLPMLPKKVASLTCKFTTFFSFHQI